MGSLCFSHFFFTRFQKSIFLEVGFFLTFSDEICDKPKILLRGAVIRYREAPNGKPGGAREGRDFVKPRCRWGFQMKWPRRQQGAVWRGQVDKKGRLLSRLHLAWIVVNQTMTPKLLSCW
jgi:hypothetical protein